MKHSIRIWGCIGLVLCMLLGNAAIFAKTDVPVFEYTLNEEETEATITKVNSLDEVIEIPDTIDGFPVVAIGDRIFSGNYYYIAKKIVIPASVTKIHPGFQWTMRTLETIEVAQDNPVYASEDGILYNKDLTTLVRFPRGKIVETYTVSQQVKKLGELAFDQTKIKNLILPDGLETIEKNALRYMEMTSISIPDSVTELGEGALSQCLYLKTVKLPEGLTEISKDLFNGCGDLLEISLPNNVTTLSEGAFHGCNDITQVELSDNITEIPPSLFAFCYKLSTLKLGSQTKSIGKDAFTHCSLISLTLPAGLETIGANAFSGNKTLTSVEVPEGVTSIGEGVFFGCDSLQSAVLPGGIETIAASTFYECVSLKQVTLPDDMTEIPNSMFNSCSSLEHVTIPSGVTKIGNSAFKQCTSLESIELPSGITEIGSNTFYGCSLLDNVVIPEGVTTLGPMAFDFCRGLKTITLPDSLNKIDAWAFEQCTSLQSITIPAGVTAIGAGAFYYCKNLSNVYFKGNAPLTAVAPFTYNADDFALYRLESATGFDQEPWNRYTVQTWEGVQPSRPEPAATSISFTTRFDFLPTGEELVWLDIQVSKEDDSDQNELIGAVRVTINGQNTMLPVNLKKNGRTDVGYSVESYRGTTMAIQTYYLGCEAFAPSASEEVLVPIAAKPGSGDAGTTGPIKPPDPNFTTGGENDDESPQTTPVVTPNPATPDPTAPQEPSPSAPAQPSPSSSPVTAPSGGGGGGGGGSRKATPSPKPVSTPLSSAPSKDVDVTFTPQQVQNGAANGAVTLTAEFPAGSSSASLALPKEAFSEETSSLKVETPLVTVALDQKAMREVSRQSSDGVTLQLNKVDPVTLPEHLQKSTSGKPVYDLKLQGNSQAVSDFKDGTVKVSIPYPLSEDEDPNNIVVYYVAEDGSSELIKQCSYQNGTVTFATGHFSTYAVSYRGHDFTDISDHWAKDSIAFVSARGIFSGMTDTEFAPNETITRAMLVTVLGRYANLASQSTPPFLDVKEDAYYMPYIAYAAQQGFIQGKTSGYFAPEDAVTREEMAVVLSAYLRSSGVLDDTAPVSKTFGDQEVVSSWAQQSLELLTQNGILKEGADGNIYPRENVTRAELAVIMQRLIQTALS